MHGYIVNILLNHSISFAAIAGAFKIKKIDSNYYPFIFLIWLGFLNETLSLILIYTVKTNTINSNIYVLAEYILILIQFYKWDNSNDSGLYYFFAFAGIFVWIGDNLVLNSINGSNSIFRIFYSIVITFFSIAVIKRLIIYENENLIKNAIFLICSCFFVYYSCKAFVEVFNAFHLGLSNAFNRRVFMILYLANLFSNIMYFIAILCIPMNQKYTQPS